MGCSHHRGQTGRGDAQHCHLHSVHTISCRVDWSGTSRNIHGGLRSGPGNVRTVLAATALSRLANVSVGFDIVNARRHRLVDSDTARVSDSAVRQLNLGLRCF